VQAAIEIRPRLKVADISEIEVETYRISVEQMGNDPSRWNPKTRETADHSMPYVVAVALLDGEVTPRSFGPERLADRAIADLIRRIKVSESAEFSAQFPESWHSRLKVKMSSGEVLASEVRYPKGHFSSPMDDAELEAKFRGMFRDYGDERQCDAALKGLWSAERVPNIADVLKLFVTRHEAVSGKAA
jgi:2-methylcitrate dehydratase